MCLPTLAPAPRGRPRSRSVSTNSTVHAPRPVYDYPYGRSARSHTPRRRARRPVTLRYTYVPPTARTHRTRSAHSRGQGDTYTRYVYSDPTSYPKGTACASQILQSPFSDDERLSEDNDPMQDLYQEAEAIQVSFEGEAEGEAEGGAEADDGIEVYTDPDTECDAGEEPELACGSGPGSVTTDFSCYPDDPDADHTIEVGKKTIPSPHSKFTPDIPSSTIYGRVRRGKKRYTTSEKSLPAGRARFYLDQRVEEDGLPEDEWLSNLNLPLVVEKIYRYDALSETEKRLVLKSARKSAIREYWEHWLVDSSLGTDATSLPQTEER
ncbi:uncharacterized protein I303_107317 [Kwoniella dejecticola CBS 10117]|uniref:Uncharacterized protein n=1 Tax=Kwoniella dejecticola CBS 10117 TaxID=1296121 RepID=A0A1A5ZZC5_9TREE|nr:uncharacterized protein I303_06721 [Kwoniella dejecticola CBS 10117]OBR83162.1 hypothetical protein I303_06721 [Kwoniella dejecticola CBS 10117]